MSNRIPVARWNRPRSDILLEHNWRSGQPPFDPFPTITNVVNAALCPVAILHDILHGDEYAAISQDESFGAGNLFQDFIASLKPAIADGSCQNDSSTMRYAFDDFARSTPDAQRQACWRYYMEPWCSRKIEELAGVRPNENFFEISVADSFVRFKLMSELTGEEGTRTYPLRGRVDEIDLTRKKLIERTIKGGSQDNAPPRLKDYQVWLEWKILSSMHRSKFPTSLIDVNFEEFDLVVETPFHDFEVPKDNPEFESRTHSAYAWIQDLTKWGRAEMEAYSNRSCTYDNRMTDCGLLRICYGRRPPYPSTRSEMHREFRNIYRPLFWQEMWDHHLFQYQLLELDVDELRDLGYVSRGKIVSYRGREIELELDRSHAQPILIEQASGETVSSYQIVVGTFHIGSVLMANLVRSQDNKFIMETNMRRLPTADMALILPSDSDSSLYREKPWFLSKLVQRDVFRLEKWGLIRPDRAAQQSVIQFMESLFGSTPLRREKNATT
jgi:hypothetical protein